MRNICVKIYPNQINLREEHFRNNNCQLLIAVFTIKIAVLIFLSEKYCIFLPAQVSTEQCPIDPLQVWNIQLNKQPLTRLKKEAFNDFPDLYAVAFVFGNLNVVERDAFKGLEGSLKEIYLRNNHLNSVLYFFQRY